MNMFPDYQPPESFQEVLAQAALVAADIDPEKRKVVAAIHSENYIPKRVLDQIGTEIASLYGLGQVELVSTHPADQLQKIEIDELMQMFIARDSMARASLAGAKWQWNENQLTICLKANGKQMLLEAVPAICRDLKERFSANVSIEIQAGEVLSGYTKLWRKCDIA